MDMLELIRTNLTRSIFAHFKLNYSIYLFVCLFVYLYCLTCLVQNRFDRNNVVACAKHFVGDGGTQNGINENNTIIDRQGLLGIHMPAYLDSLSKSVSTVMISYSSWNGVKMHANRDLITGYLKKQLRFKVCGN
jgi:Glycosyl hydrolase family 3 N terminal domain